jgi:hypothetical protein
MNKLVEVHVREHLDVLNVGLLENHDEHAMAHFELAQAIRAEMLALKFPEDKRRIAKLSHDDKMEWYAHQFQVDPRGAAVNLSTKEFERFWKWRVVIPMKVKRFFYRVKNGEIFKHYQHITEMKKKVKPHSI